MNPYSWQSADYNLWLLIPLSILGYSLLNAFVIWRLKPLWPQNNAWRIGILSVIISLIILLFSGYFGDDVLSDYGYYLGNFWAGMVLLLTVGVIAMMLLKGFVSLLNVHLSREKSCRTERIFLSGVLLIAFVLCIYGIFQTRTPKIERLELTTNKNPEQSASSLKIVQVSDVHSGFVFNSPGLERLVEAIKEANPDILVSTGDLFDRITFRAGSVVEAFKNVKPRYGKYAVTGNHEVYAGMDWAVDMTKRAGFSVLQDTSITIDRVINIAGIDDPADASEDPVKEANILGHTDTKLMTIFLKHEPVSLKSSRNKFDVQLSGHLHGGGFPFRWLIAMHHDQLEGYKAGTKMYVSRGWGTTEFPISRIGARPEILVITIKKE